MKLLTTIYGSKDININGSASLRTAVRSIIFERDKLLMVFSKANGDYKFPGGGVMQGEDHQNALIREIREETGVKYAEIVSEYGKVIEYRPPKETEHDVFKMTSYYYVCEIGKEIGSQELDPYEEELGFTACWVSVEEALEQNKIILREPIRKIPSWTRREVFVLELLKGNGLE